MARNTANSDSSPPEGPALCYGSTQSLKIIIMGAGIAGLSAAVGLRRAGHDVEVPYRCVLKIRAIGPNPVRVRSSSNRLLQTKLVLQFIFVQMLRELSFAGDLIRFERE